jgi:hypothetical protein
MEKVQYQDFFDSYEPLNEGAWESVKYGLSKLGRYKAGGKILGKGKVDAENEAKLKDLLRKTANEKIDQLDNLIKKSVPEFPNNKKEEDFLDIVLEVAKVYDSLVEATKLDPKDKDFLPVDAANAIIKDLGEYVKQFLDVKLTAAYSVTRESQNIDDEFIAGLLLEGGYNLDLLVEASDAVKKKREQVKQKLGGTKGAIEKGEEEEYGTERMKTLRSWKLPIALLGTGAAFGALGWLIKGIIGDAKEVTITNVKEGAESLTDVQPGEGATQLLNRAFGLNLSPNSSPEEFLAAVKKVGNGDLNKGIELFTEKGGVFKDPDAARETIEAIAKNPDKYGDTLKDVFKGDWAGTGRTPTDTLVTLPGTSLKALVVKTVIRKAMVEGTKYALAAPILKTLGIALLGGGVAVALARYKGRKSSRAQVLNDLFQYIRPVKGTAENQPIIGVQPTAPTGAQANQKPKQAGGAVVKGGGGGSGAGNVPQLVAAAKGSTKNVQYGILFKVATNGKSDIFKLLNKQPGEAFSDKELDPIVKGQDPQASILARAIMASRKNPDQFLKKFATALGGRIDTTQRQRGFMQGAEKKGVSGSGVGTGSVKEILKEEFEMLLTEALLDDLLADVAKLPKEVKLNLLGLVADMYVQDGKDVSIVDPKEFGFSAQEIADAGFTFEPTSKRYVKLQRGQTKAQAMSFDKNQAKTQTAMDANNIAAALKKRPAFKTALSKINTADEFAMLVLALFTKIDPTLANDNAKMTSAVNTLRSRLAEAVKPTPPETQAIIDLIDRDTALAALFAKLNTVEEVIQVILRGVVPMLNPALKKDKNLLKTALATAVSQYAVQSKSTKPGASKKPAAGTKPAKPTKPTTPAAGSQPVPESFIRMQRLAGII